MDGALKQQMPATDGCIRVAFCYSVKYPFSAVLFFNACCIPAPIEGYVQIMHR